MVLFFMELSTRRVQLDGITSVINGLLMAQIARNLTDGEDGFCNKKRYLIYDRDPLGVALDRMIRTSQELLRARWRLYRCGTLLTAPDKLSFIEKIEYSSGLAPLHGLGGCGKIQLGITSWCRPELVSARNSITHPRQQIAIRQRFQRSEFPVA